MRGVPHGSESVVVGGSVHMTGKVPERIWPPFSSCVDGTLEVDSFQVARCVKEKRSPERSISVMLISM